MLHSKIEGFCFTQAIDDQVHIDTSSVLLLWKAIFSVFRPWSSGRGKSNISKYRMSDVCPTTSTQQHHPCIRTVTDKPPTPPKTVTDDLLASLTYINCGEKGASLAETTFLSLENYHKDLVVVDEHISQTLNTAVLDRLRLWLLQVAVMRGEPDF
jgi:hypothetical protein